MKNTKKSKRGGSQKVYCVLKWISRKKGEKEQGRAASAVRKGSAVTGTLSTAHSSEQGPKKTHLATRECTA